MSCAEGRTSYPAGAMPGAGSPRGWMLPGCLHFPPHGLDTYHLSGRTGTNSGGCLSATSAAAPSSTCASPTRSLTWSRRRWWPRAVAAVACSSRSSRRAAGWGAPGEVGPSVPLLLPWQAAGASPLGGDRRTRHLAWPGVDILHWCHHLAEGLALSPSSMAMGGRDSRGSSVEELTLLLAACMPHVPSSRSPAGCWRSVLAASIAAAWTLLPAVALRPAD